MAEEQISALSRKPIRLADYTKPAFAVDEVALDFDLDPAATIVRATLKLRRQAPGPLILDGKRLELRAVRLNDEALGDNRYEVTEKSLTVHDVPDSFVLQTEVQISPETNTELSGLYMSGAGFFTQCEPEGFRKITYFPDRPDVMARYKVTMRADKAKYPVLLSNGNKTGAGEDGGKNLGLVGRPAPEAFLSLRAGRGRSGRGEGSSSPPHRAGMSISAFGSRRATRGVASMRCMR